MQCDRVRVDEGVPGPGGQVPDPCGVERLRHVRSAREPRGEFGVHTTVLAVSLYMLVLGLGLGMVMQVLVLAVQNAVQPRVMGVATSATIMFRQIGGSVGIALFGAVFANRLHANLARLLPAGSQGPRAVTPAAVKSLPPHVRDLYVRAFADSLHPVFIVGAGIAVLSFLLTWMLRELPLRKSTEPVPAAQ